MKHQIISDVANDSLSQSTPRAIQTRFDSSKTYAHRYERRQVREVLRATGRSRFSILFENTIR